MLSGHIVLIDVTDNPVIQVDGIKPLLQWNTDSNMHKKI